MSIQHVRMKLGALVLALAAASCGTTPNPASCLDNHCSDPDRPYCDKDGSIGGEPNTCIAVACTPGEFERCNGENAMHCNALGNGFEELQCSEGCNGSKGCNECEDVGTCTPPTHIVPRYLPDVCDAVTPSGNDLVVVPSATIDTSMDANCNGGVVAQPTGPFLCVLRYRSIVVPSGRTLKFTGPRAVALVVDDALSIEGVLDVSADGDTAGPGARPMGVSGTIPSGPNAGYAGAGFQSKGGDGASSGGATGGIGGPAEADPVFEPYLEGGTSARCHFLFSAFGRGGGAVALTSCRGQVSISGLVDAGGSGGPGGVTDLFGNPQSACGGGSGGHIVVQGRTVTVTGSVLANGGGGGAGYISGAQGMRGEDGSRDPVIPAYGGSGANGAGTGGNGAAGIVPVGGNGLPGTTGTGGGGGGGYGFLQIFTPFGVTPTIADAKLSPQPQPHRNVDMK